MLSYLHAFHAGGWADVFKHAALALLVDALRKKETPFAYLETHAGRGLYELDSAAAQQTREHEGGIGRLGLNPEGASPDLEPYLDAVRAVNPSGALRFYPGSPSVVRPFLRANDRMTLAELHPAEVAALKRLFAHDRQVSVHPIDGHAALRSMLPPREKRGLVFVDPSYEVKSEYLQAARAIATARQRFSAGVFAIWYPILSNGGWRQLLGALKAGDLRKVFRAELLLRPADTREGLNGSGLVVVNAPWRWDEKVSRLLPWLCDCLAHPGHAATTIAEWLVPE